MDCINKSAISWSLSHILKYGDTDIFPIPFEYYCLKAQWTTVLDALANVDFGKHEISTSLRCMVPKHTTGLRASTQLDPIDCILFTAAVTEHARLIERYRAPKSDKTACSYRLEVKADGQLFQPDTGWGTFHNESVRLCNLARTSFVVTADIVDFYNNVSHHRIQNSLQSAGVPSDRCNSIEFFLGNICAKHHSRGVPVGPTASILLTELCLADVDQNLNRLAAKSHHTRYVDDFRVFCQNRLQAVDVLHGLSEYLYTAHRLALQNDKTKIWNASDFEAGHLHDPQEMEVANYDSEIAKLVAAIDASPYGEPPSEDDVDDTEKKKVARGVLKSLLNEIVVLDALPIGIARYVLRRAAAIKTRVLLPDVLEHVEELLPVLRDVVNYAVKVYDKKNPRQVGDALYWLANKSDYRHLPFVQYWVADAFCRVPAFVTASKAMSVAEDSDPLLRDRLSALIAKEYGVIDWVRGRKETWQSSPPWGQRAIVWSSSVLPQDERRHWLKQIHSYPDLLTATVAKSVKA